MKNARTPRNHLTIKDAALRLGHCTRWVRQKITNGELEGFKHSPTNITVSVESIVAYEERTRMHIRIRPTSTNPASTSINRPTVARAA